MQKTTHQFALQHTGGEDIYFFTLRNNKGTSVKITNYGAIITSFCITDKNGYENDIVLGFDQPADYLSPEYLAGYSYFGAAIGRYCNRIKNGRFSIDGKDYQLAQNKFPDHLHGGNEGFDKKVWDFISLEDSPNPKLILHYKSKDGEEGYPGNLDVTITFELNDDNELSYAYTATCDQPTAINLTHHSYFNLNNGKGQIDDHYAMIQADNILEQDDNFVVTGKFLPVKGTKYDFTSPKRINADWDAEAGYDQSYPLNEINREKPAAEAYCRISGVNLQVFTTAPLVHFYTGKWNPTLMGKNGIPYGPFNGFCFETHQHPNSINIPGFPKTTLYPGEVYRSKTIYKVTQEGEK